MTRDSFIIYRSFCNPIKGLTNEDKGVLFESICNYALDGITPHNLSPILELAFKFITETIDRDAEKYKNIIERNRKNIGKRWNKNDTKDTTGISGKIWNSDNDNVNDNANDNVNEDKKTRVFIPPTLSVFQKYFADNGYSVETAKRAFEGYQVSGWIDSKGNPIKNWKQKCQFVWFKPENLIDKTNAPKSKIEIKTNPDWL